MTEIDWDKIIRDAQSRKNAQSKDAPKDKNIDKRLDRVEKILEKAVYKNPDKNDYADNVPERQGDGDLYKEKLKKAGFKFVKIEKKRSMPSVPQMPDMKSVFSSRRNLGIVAVIIALVAFGGIYATGGFPSGMAGMPSDVTMYVCPDGVTTVENITLCPTTTTTTIETTTTTVPPTTTTTIVLGSKHSVGITESSCSGGMISVTIQSTSPEINNIGYLTFYIDGERDNLFLCTSNVLAPGETTVCHSISARSGVHNVEARSLVNIAYTTVTC